jgi:glycosyltransferase involved in cell wall biosynthesis/ubiquinone/menaquinone biosynthesis C-methylase UbiE
MLEWTGERFLPYVDPSISGAEIHYEHLHRYAFTLQYIKGKKVLDLASGEGYGSFLLSKSAESVTGIEIDVQSVNHASEIYKKDNLRFLQGSIVNIPIEGEKVFDVIVCFEALEHIKEHEILLSEIKRLIKDDGILIISTPNKLTYSDIPDYHNPFHVKEIYFKDFYDLLKKKFAYVYLFGQRVISGSSIFPNYSNSTNDSCSEFVITYEADHFSFIGDDEKKPLYFIAIASKKKLSKKILHKSFLTDVSNKVGSVLQNQNSDLLNQNSDLLNQNSVLQSQNSVLQSQNSVLQSQNSVLQSQNSDLSNQNSVLQSQISDLQNQINQYSQSIQTLNTTILTREKELSDTNIRLMGIEQSIVWRITMKFHIRVIERLLPQTTSRRRYYDLGRAGGKILVNDGFQAFYYSFKRYIHNDKKLNRYHLWIKNNEPGQDELKRLKKISQNFPYLPKISILIPVWNTDKKWLRLAIESAINQVYENLEICIVDGGSTKRYIQQIITEYAQKDPRIKLKFLAENEGISGNSNEALALATGEYVGFLDHDDELAPFALHEVIAVLNQNQNFEFIYSDEDKIDQKGKRKDPFFKPDWSPDLFLSQNYLCHFSVIRKTLIDSVGGFHTGYEGSQDYDLFLRCTEKISPSSIAHIPKILYHWRIIPGSAADHVVAKPYAITSAKKALEDALLRRGQKGNVEEGIFPGSYRIRYVIQDNPLISIIIPTKDHVDVFKRCIQSILDKTDYKNYEIIIVDNQSTEEETFEYYSSLGNNPKIKILSYDKPFNFSAINNYAVDNVDAPYILFLNNDTEVISGEWLSAMLEHAQRGDVGTVGAKLLYPNNLIQHAGVILGITGTPGQKGVAGHSHKYLPDKFAGYFLRSQIIGNYSAVTAACLMMRKDVFKEIGGFNEDLAVAFNDVDLCMKIRSAGYLIVYTPYSQLYHHESLSRGYEDTPDKQVRFKHEVSLIREKWGGVIDNGDPYYNPNLTLEREDFSIKFE